MDEILSLDEKKREEIFKQIEKFRSIEMPWNGFPDDAEREIKKIIVSQKPKDKLLIQPEKDNLEKLQIKIRGQLHEPMPFGITNDKEAKKVALSQFSKQKFATEKAIERIVDENLKDKIRSHFVIQYKKNKTEAFSAEGIKALNAKRKVPVFKVKLYYKNQDLKISVRKLGQKKSDTQNLIDLIIDKDIREEIINHFEKFSSDKTKAFSKEGIYELNKDRKKPLKSLKLVNMQEEENEEENITLQRIYRKKSYNKKLYVNTSDNYLFAVMEKEGKRIFDLISFFDAANLLKDEFNNAENKIIFNKNLVFKKYFEEKNGAKILFTLKQGDTVYMPRKEEEIILDPVSPFYAGFWNDKALRSENTHYVTKYSGKEIYFIKHNVADIIVKGKEFGSQNAYQKIEDRSIKDYCIKLDIDRLGNIKPAL